MFKETKFEITPENVLGSEASYSGFSFGCAREPVDGKIQLVNSHHSCREGLMSRMRGRITAGDKDQPTDKMRMIFRFACSGNADCKSAEAWMGRAVPVLHAFDKLAGWPLTRVYKITTNHDDWLRAYYTHSSRRWMKSSYLVSLYCMLVRVCKDERIKGFKDFKGLVKVIQKCIDSGTNLKMDHTYVRDSMPYWEALMKGYPRLFRQRKMPYYWDSDRLGRNTSSSEGIQYLVKGDTSYAEVRSELLKIHKELKDGTFSPEVEKKKKK